MSWLFLRFMALLLVALATVKNVEAACETLSRSLDSILSADRMISGPHLRPQGDAIVFLTTRWDDDALVRSHKPTGSLWLRRGEQSVKMGEARGIHDPVWSPDGSMLAYFDGLGPGRQLVIAQYDEGGLTERLRIAAPGDVAQLKARHFSPIWMPDSSQVIFTASDSVKTAENEQRPFTLGYASGENQLDHHYRDDMLRRLSVLDVKTGETRVVGASEALRDIQLSPDGKRIYYAAADLTASGKYIGDAFFRPRRMHLFDPEGAATSRINPPADADFISWISDEIGLFQQGNSFLTFDMARASARERQEITDVTVRGVEAAGAGIAYWGTPKDPVETGAPSSDYLNAPPGTHSLYIMDISSGARRRVLDHRDGFEVLSVRWSKAKGKVAAQVRSLETLTEALLIVDQSDNRRRLVPVDGFSIQDFILTPNGARVLARAGGAVHFETLIEIDVETGAIEFLDTPVRNAALDTSVKPVIIEYETSKGELRKALLYAPKKRNKKTDTPLVVTAYGRKTNGVDRFDAAAQLHVACGYAYLAPDIYVERGRLYDAYVASAPPAIAAAKQHADIKGRVGFLGGSLGGYAGLVLLGKTNVLDAAVLRAPPSELSMSWATGKDRDADLLEFLMMGKTPFHSKQDYDANSPFWFADEMTAPLLILHGENDMQVPVEQGIWTYQALRRMGRKVEMRIYPEADHSIVRGSRSNFKDYYEQTFRWWDLHLTQKEHVREDE